MLRRIFGIATIACAVATPANAQIRRAPRGGGQGQDANYWVGGSFGLLELGTVTDNSTNARWGFGYTSQLAATLEKEVSRGTAIGVTAAFASPNLTYESGTFSSSCPFSCTAK